MRAGKAFTGAQRDAVYRAIAERRDVREGFLDVPLPDSLLMRILGAAHSAPSVGLMQPTRFIVVRDLELRREVHAVFAEANTNAAATYDGEQRRHYKSLKLAGILEAPQNICVLCDADSKRGHRLGRHTEPQTAAYSTVCAIQNLWLAARAEGVAVGWVSILDPLKLRTILRIPKHLSMIAYLCIGYVNGFATSPDLERQGWEERLPLEKVLSMNIYSEQNA